MLINPVRSFDLSIKLLCYRPNDQITVNASSEIELMPTFGTSFPESHDGSNGAGPELAGLWDTMGILPNRITNRLGINYITEDGLNIFGGLTHQMVQIDGGSGHLGRANIGVANESLRASAFIQGALDERTPLFIPGAQREVGFGINWCERFNEQNSSVCLGLDGRKAIQDGSWSGHTNAEIRF